MSIQQAAFPFCLFILLVAGCDKKRQVDTDRVKPATVAADSWPSPSDAECQQFASKLEQAAAANNASAMNDMIDWDVLLEKATGGIEGADAFRRQFNTGVKSALRGGPTSLGAQIVGAVSQGGSYKLLRVRGSDKRKRVLFRLLLPNDGGVNYHELTLAKRPDGQTKALDIYIFLSAETMSTTVRRAFLPVVASQQRSLLEKLSRKDNDFVTNAPQLEKMTSAIKSGRFQEALDIYGRLPESLQNDKMFLLVRLQAAMQLSDKEHMATIDAFRKHHPNDPCIDMLSIDGYLMKGSYDDALASIDRLDKSVGGDEYLNILRANVLTEKGDYQQASEVAQQAIDRLPDFQDAYWSMVSISMRDKNFDDTVYWLNQLEQKFQMDFADFTTIPEFAEFVDSPQFRDWQKTR